MFISRIFQALAVATLVATVSAQGLPLVQQLQPALPGVGSPTVSSLGDVNGDGTADVIVAQRGNVFVTAEVEILSGATGFPLFTLQRPAGASSLFGQSVADVGDWNGDGIHDVLVADPGLSGTGALLIFAGDTGLELARFNGFAAGDLFGQGVDLLPDRDGDGRPELLVGSPLHDEPGLNDAGRVDILSSLFGAPLLTIVGSAAAENLGAGVDAMDDIDMDGMADLAVSAPGSTLTPRGIVWSFSGMTGANIQTYIPPVGLATLSRNARLESISDMDGDGIRDLVGSWQGTSVIFGSTSATEIRSYESDYRVPSIGRLGDLNGDGQDDFFYGDQFDQLVVVSGADGCELFRFEDNDRQTAAAFPDSNGDGLPEVIVSRGLPSLPSIETIAGRLQYKGQGPLEPLDLEWQAGPAGNALDGDLTLTGGASSASGALAVSLAPAVIPVGGFDILLDVSQWLVLPVQLDAAGTLALPLSIDAPSLSGTSLFFQGFEAAAASPIGVFASNGLEVLLSAEQPAPIPVITSTRTLPVDGDLAAAGNSFLIIEGSGFLNSTVTVGGQIVTPFNLAPNLITLSTPPVPVGPVIVTVTSPNGTASVTLTAS